MKVDLAKSPRRRLVSLLFFILPAISAHAVISVTITAGEDLTLEPRFADSSETPLEEGNQFILGTISNVSGLQSAQENFPTVMNDFFTEFGRSDNSVESKGIWAEDVDAGRAAGGGTATIEGPDTFEGDTFFLMVVKTLNAAPLAANFSNLLEYGIFGASDPSSVVFPAPGTSPAPAFWSDFFDEIIVGGSAGPALSGSGLPEFYTLHAPTIVPEPSVYAALFGVLGLMVVVLERRRRRD